MSEQAPLRERTIGEYLDTLGSSSPAPGGGSVAGLVGALAAGLGRMVTSLTKGNDALAGTSAGLEADMADLVASAEADERAYSGYVAATRLPKGTDDEKAARRAAMQAALVNAAETPLALATTAAHVLELLEPVAREGTTHALSDAEIAVALAGVAVTAGLSNVRSNIPLIRDATLAAGFAARAGEVEATARDRVEALNAILRARAS